MTGLATGQWVKSGTDQNSTTILVLSTTFVQGYNIVFRGQIVNVTGLPLRNASFDLNINGQESFSKTSASSDSDGMAEATWNTQAPNRKGQGGSATGAYTASVSGVSAGR